MARKIDRLAILTHDLFFTPHDQANRATVAAVQPADLNLAGLAIHAHRKIVEKVIDKPRPTRNRRLSAPARPEKAPERSGAVKGRTTTALACARLR